MSAHSAPHKRGNLTLTPCISLTLIDGDIRKQLAPNEIVRELVGQKAFGLASLPHVWTKPFFVVSGKSRVSEDALAAVVNEHGFTPEIMVYVRSSGTDESIHRRGAYVSKKCRTTDIAKFINSAFDQEPDECDHQHEHIHWVVQQYISGSTKGHLSNERRLSQHDRDWVAEVEAIPKHPSETHPIAIRSWRDPRPQQPKELHCQYRANYIGCLKKVARWAYALKTRIHFEWVWDGQKISIVQADACTDDTSGTNPTSTVVTPDCSTTFNDLCVFREAASGDYSKYRKLANARIYKELGYETVQFFILDDPDEINQIVINGAVHDKLSNDLEMLSGRPLVLRTDGLNIPDEKKVMLPRSDELRSKNDAINWLKTEFRKRIKEIDLQESRLCLIAHNFLPAVASAWCQAHPDKRKVRIEALWGIPEGLYWYAHDVFDVDTRISDLTCESKQPKTMPTNKRLRYKNSFIAPDPEGAWILHKTCIGPDWGKSIQKQAWVNEIAWTSRKIAVAEGHPVVVMWFIDVPEIVSKHPVMPWYHEEGRSDPHDLKAAPRKKSPLSTEFILSTKEDWHRLIAKCTDGESISRVYVNPKESDLVRDQKFARELGNLAKNKEFVIELSGGILSHAYYLLTQSQCAVECSDLYATHEEKIEFNKLVRDKIPEIIHSHGENVELINLEGEALIEALKHKIVEEAYEVLDSGTTDQIIEELADLIEVTDALMHRLKITKSAVDRVKKKKSGSRGAFDKAFMLSRTTIEPPIKSAIRQNDVHLPNGEQASNQVISNIIDLPSRSNPLHIDKRYDVKNTKDTSERQFTTTFSVYEKNYSPPRVNFPLETNNQNKKNFSLEATVDRVNAELKLKLRLISWPVQAELPFPPSGDEEED